MASTRRKQGPALRFSRLRLRNWKNFQSVDVALTSRVFIVGPNASGKSNLLDVFRFLRDLVSEGGGFQAAVRKRGGVRALRCLAARRPSDIEIHVEISSPQDSLWTYTLQFNQGKQHRPVIQKERVMRRNPETGEWITLLDRPTEEDRRDPERLTQTHLEQVTMNQAFRELAEFFASVRYLHLVPQIVREPERYIVRPRDPYGGDFLEQLAKTPKKTRDARLRKIQEALKVAVPQLLTIELWRDERGTPHLRAKYQHWRARGVWQTEEQFSDGTLRLMGLLWAILDGKGPLLLEEPELSLHPEVVRHIPQMFARVQRHTGRQILVSTHSPELLEDRGIGMEEVLLLIPDKESTKVTKISQIEEARELLEHGVSVGEIAMAHTRPDRAKDLPLFPDL